MARPPIDDVPLAAEPIRLGQFLKLAGLVPSTAEANRNLEQGGVRVDGDKVTDRGLKLPAGTYVVQVGKRRFARVTLTA